MTNESNSGPKTATLRGGLIQMALKASTDNDPETIRQAMIEAHIPMIEQAGKAGVQVLCFQEVFTQPYFCPSQDSKWYDSAEPIPNGPTTKLMQEYAVKYDMVIVVPIYERDDVTGIYYNTAAVIDADGTYLGKYRKTHIPQVSGFWEKFFFKPGTSDWPVFDTKYCKLGVYICYDRHFPEGWRSLALNGAEYIVNPSATVAGLSEYLWQLEQPASAAANGCWIGAINHWLRRSLMPTAPISANTARPISRKCPASGRSFSSNPAPLTGRCSTQNTANLGFISVMTATSPKAGAPWP